MKARHLLAFLILTGACQINQSVEVGTLMGQISIGPLCPVEPCQLSTAQLDNIYARYRLLFNDVSTGKTEATLTNLDHTGAYKLTLKAGRYLLLCETCLRKTVASDVDITAGKTTQKDFYIDTGIR